MRNILVLAMLALFLVAVATGMMVGASRGRKKAFLRLLTLIGAFFLALIFTPSVSKFAGEFALEYFGTDLGDATINSLMVVIKDNYDDLSGLLLIIVNPVVFLGLFTVFWIISTVPYFILAATVGKRKRREDGRKESRKAFGGMIMGALCGFVLFFATFVTYNGYLTFAEKAKKISFVNDQLVAVEEFEIAGFGVNFDEYSDNFIIDGIGLFGFDGVCFEYLTTAEVSGKTVVLSSEIDALVRTLNEALEIDTENILGDPEAIQAVADAAFSSNIVTICIDYVLDYLLENDEAFDAIIPGSDSEGGEDVQGEDGEASTENVIDEMLSDKEFMRSTLTKLKGNVQVEVNGCIDVLRVINTMGISLTEFNMDALASLDDTKVDNLVSSIINAHIIRDMLPFLTVGLIKPIGDTLGVDTSNFVRPTITDEEWEIEKVEISKVFKGIFSLSEFMDATEGEGDTIEAVGKYFANKNNVNAMANLMYGLRDSKLVAQLYDSLTEYDEQKEEYFFIHYLDGMIFGNQPSPSPAPLAKKLDTFGDDNDSPVASLMTVRSLFSGQSDAQKDPSMEGGRDTIDFDKFDWNVMFNSMAGVAGLARTAQDLQGKTITEASKEDIIEMLRTIDGIEDKQMVNNIISSLVPPDLGIVVPDLEGVDIEKEIVVVEKLFDYQEKYMDEQQSFGEGEIAEMVGTLSESQVMLEMLKSSETKVDASESEQAEVLAALNDPENDYSEEFKDAVLNLFGMNDKGQN